MQALLATLTTGVPLVLSVPRGARASWLDDVSAAIAGDEAHPPVGVVAEDEAGLVERLASGAAERLRVVAGVSLDVRAAAHRAGIAVIDAPVMATGRLELRWYLREQTVSRVRHRYGNVIGAARSA